MPRPKRTARQRKFDEWRKSGRDVIKPRRRDKIGKDRSVGGRRRARQPSQKDAGRPLRKRGECAYCGRLIARRKSGVLYPHHVSRGIIRTPCKGAGTIPVRLAPWAATPPQGPLHQELLDTQKLLHDLLREVECPTHLEERAREWAASLPDHRSYCNCHLPRHCACFLTCSCGTGP